MRKNFAAMIITFVGTVTLSGCGATGAAFLEGMAEGSAQHQRQWQSSNYGGYQTGPAGYQYGSTTPYGPRYSTSSATSTSNSPRVVCGLPDRPHNLPNAPSADEYRRAMQQRGVVAGGSDHPACQPTQRESGRSSGRAVQR